MSQRRPGAVVTACSVALPALLGAVALAAAGTFALVAADTVRAADSSSAAAATGAGVTTDAATASPTAPASAPASATGSHAASASANAYDDAAHRLEVEEWRARVDRALRQDHGWLTLVGRDELRPGPNRVGSAADNDVAVSPELAPAHLGTLHVDDFEVRLTLAPGVRMTAIDPATGAKVEFSERVLRTSIDNRDWVSLGRLSFRVIHLPSRDRYVLNTADDQAAPRRDFKGRIWYPVDPRYRVAGRFVPYDPPRTVEIVNVLGEVADENMVGYVDFTLDGQALRLDALAEGETLWFLLRDRSAGDTTYPAGRYLSARRQGGAVVLDFNRAHNPPCAFSKYTTCPLPPPQNDLAIRIDAGEKYVAPE